MDTRQMWDLADKIKSMVEAVQQGADKQKLIDNLEDKVINQSSLHRKKMDMIQQSPLNATAKQSMLQIYKLYAIRQDPTNRILYHVLKNI